MTDLSTVPESALKIELNNRHKHRVENYSFLYEWGYQGKGGAERFFRCVEVPAIFQVISTKRKRGGWPHEWQDSKVTFVVEKDDNEYDTFGEVFDRYQFMQELKDKKNIVEFKPNEGCE